MYAESVRRPRSATRFRGCPDLSSTSSAVARHIAVSSLETPRAGRAQRARGARGRPFRRRQLIARPPAAPRSSTRSRCARCERSGSRGPPCRPRSRWRSRIVCAPRASSSCRTVLLRGAAARRTPRSRRYPPLPARDRGGDSAARDLLRQARTATASSCSTESRSTLRAHQGRARARVQRPQHGRRGDDRLHQGRRRRWATTRAPGPIRAGRADPARRLFRDRESSCWADMTRTFVVGDVPDEVAEWHRLCKRGARPRARATIRPGVTGRSVFDGVVRDLRGARAIRPSARRRAGETLDGRLLPLARPRRRARGARAAAARHDAATTSSSPGDVARGRAGPVPRGLRRLPPRGPRARDRGRRRER